MLTSSIPMIVVTGGPCGGKSLGVEYLRTRFTNLGFYPVIVPEFATILINTGIHPSKRMLSNELFQTGIFDLILHLENNMIRFAEALRHPKPVIIADRGLIDGKAYVGRAAFNRILNRHGFDSEVPVWDRYLGALHMVTAAIGAEAHYTTANNSARKETRAEAIARDKATQDAWLGHPHVAIIGNENRSFDEKLEELFRGSCRVLGIPVPLEIERKFLVKDFSLVGTPHQPVQIEQMYLVDPSGTDAKVRIRKRGIGGDFSFSRTLKETLRSGVRIERELIISEREYRALTDRKIPGSRTIRKRRSCFVWQEQYFELDVFQTPHQGLSLLEIELTEENRSIAIPPFVNIDRDVTDEVNYSNFALAMQ